MLTEVQFAVLEIKQQDDRAYGEIEGADFGLQNTCTVSTLKGVADSSNRASSIHIKVGFFQGLQH